jgi:pyruvate dehydrogenase E2 component (dihydrolipoamide acetyltransferase)
MDEGVFEGWLKQDGDLVQPGEALFALEGEKATQDIEAIDGGILRIPPNAPQPGDTVPVGAVLAYLFAAGETVSWDSMVQTGQAPKVAAVGQTASVGGPPAPVIGKHVPGPAVAKAGKISPRALRVALELGVDWAQVQPTGSTGRIRERDVRSYFEQQRGRDKRAAQYPHGLVTPLGGRIVPFTSQRKLIAARLRVAHEAAIPVTLVTEVDVTTLAALRRDRQQAAHTSGVSTVPTYTDIIIKLSATALEQHRMLTAQWTDEGLFIPDSIHINIAVDTEAGLVAPLIRDVLQLDITHLAQSTRRLIELAHARRLTADQSAPGTFTVSNLGMYGIDAFTPVLNPPQSAILGIGRIRRVPAVLQDQIVPREQVTLCLTFDHRVMDGAPAAKFLETLGGLLQNPNASLLSDG